MKFYPGIISVCNVSDSRPYVSLSLKNTSFSKTCNHSIFMHSITSMEVVPTDMPYSMTFLQSEIYGAIFVFKESLGVIRWQW